MPALQAGEIQRDQRDGWAVPPWCLPLPRLQTMVAALDELLRRNPGVAVNFAQPPLWLVKGRDVSGLNDFSVGHPA